MLRLILVFTWHELVLLGLSCHGSNYYVICLFQLYIFILSNLQLTLGDLALFVYLESLAVHEDLVKYPKLKENRTMVAALPRIAKYMENRPVTEF